MKSRICSLVFLFVCLGASNEQGLWLVLHSGRDWGPSGVLTFNPDWHVQGKHLSCCTISLAALWLSFISNWNTVLRKSNITDYGEDKEDKIRKERWRVFSEYTQTALISNFHGGNGTVVLWRHLRPFICCPFCLEQFYLCETTNASPQLTLLAVVWLSNPSLTPQSRVRYPFSEIPHQAAFPHIIPAILN